MIESEVTTIEQKLVKTKTHSSIALKLETIEQLNLYRKYQRETYDEILVRLMAQIESRKGKKRVDEE